MKVTIDASDLIDVIVQMTSRGVSTTDGIVSSMKEVGWLPEEWPNVDIEERAVGQAIAIDDDTNPNATGRPETLTGELPEEIFAWPHSHGWNSGFFKSVSPGDERKTEGQRYIKVKS